MSAESEERILKELWSAIFKTEDLGPESDFFALGGESIAAIEMIIELERLTGRLIPIGTLYSASTIRQFAEAVHRIESDDKTPIVTPLNDLGQGRPLFLIAPAIGGVVHYRDFWQHIGEQHRSFCIEPRISVRGEHRYSSVEEVAHCLILEMRKIQPDGPYRMCGYSFGGTLAWEMARQLEIQGERIDCLIALDSGVRGSGWAQSRAKEGPGYWFKMLCQAHRAHRANGEWLNVSWISRLVLKKVVHVLSGKGSSSAAQELMDAQAQGEVENRVQENLRATYDYGTYSGELILLRARQQLTLHRQLQYDLGWKGRPEGGLRTIPIPGHHLNMMKPPVCAEIANKVGGLLDELEPNVVELPAEEVLPRKPVTFPHGSVSTVLGQFYDVLNTLGNESAIFDEGELVSFRLLNHRANVIAEALSNISSPEAGTYVFLPTTHWMIAAFLGVFKAAHYYVPIDPEHPDSRIRLIVEDADCSCVITSRDLEERVEEIFCGKAFKAVYLEDLDFSGERLEQQNRCKPEDLGAILYTSGSTGKPKGVVHTQKSISYVAWRRGAGISLNSNDRYLQIYSGAFMGALNGIYGSLLYGSCLYIYSLKKKGVAYLGPWLIAHRITILHAVTSIYRQFVGTIGKDTKFPAIRCVTPGGEPSRMSDILRFKQHFERGSVYYANLGSSECGSISFDPIRHETDVHPDIPVGVPFDTLEVLILDEKGEPVPAEAEGQIAILSDSIFKEYWKNPEKTSTVLKPRPDGRSLFLTGDFGYLMLDGRLVNKGRQDGQVKINGYRVEIPEVESALLSISDVRETAVVTREDPDGNIRLAAFIRSDDKNPGAVSRICAKLLELLPRPMVPTTVILVSRFPVKDNGKLDRNVLSTVPVEEMDFAVR